MTKKYTIVVEKGEDGYLVSEVLELPGCHTQAKNYDELILRTKEAISIYLEQTEQPQSNFLSIESIEV